MSDRGESPEVEDLLARAVRAWRGAQVVHIGEARGGGLPEAVALVEEVARRPELEARLFDLLGDPSPLVAAHSLMALESMGSARLGGLPEALLASRSNVPLRIGSFRIDADLGGLARRARMRAGNAGELPLPGEAPAH